MKFMLSNHKSYSLLINRFLRTVTFIYIYIINSAIAAPLNEYCISKVGGNTREPAVIKKTSNHINESYLSQTREIFSDNDKLTVDIVEHSLVNLINKKNNEIIAELDIPLAGEREYIEQAFVTEDNWAFITSTFNNYMIKIEVEDSTPILGKTTKLPAIYSEKCNRFIIWLFDSKCSVSYVSYSSTLNRAFLSGYRDTFFGYKKHAIEIISGKEKILPLPKKNKHFVVDIPKFNGVLFTSTNTELLFYDGDNMVVLPLEYLKKHLKGEKISYYMKGPFAGYPQETLGGRVFLLTSLNDSKQFILELKPDLSFSEISLPETIKEQNIGFRIYTLSNDSRLFAITNSSILMEVDNKLQSVAFVNKPYVIFSELTEESPIPFKIKNTLSKKFTNYHIKHASPEANCKFMLNTDKPILLKPKF